MGKSIVERIKEAADSYNKEVLSQEEESYVPVDFNDEENVKPQMAEALDANPEDIEISLEDYGPNSFGKGLVYTITYNDDEYSVVKDEDTAEDIALALVKQDLEDESELVDRDFLLDNIDLVAAESFFREIYDEFNESYARDIMGEGDTIGEYDNRLIQEMVERGVVDEDTTKSEDFDPEDYIDKFVENMTDEQIEEGNGGYDYYAFNFGEEEATKLIFDNNLIDIDEAAQNAINVDGWRHFLCHYDGESSTTPAGFVYWREN